VSLPPCSYNAPELRYSFEAYLAVELVTFPNYTEPMLQAMTTTYTIPVSYGMVAVQPSYFSSSYRAVLAAFQADAALPKCM
jgi:hypothetical protein